MKHRVSELILAKQKSTMAMALSIANDKKLASDIIDKNITQNYYDNLIKKYKTHTQYKNVWIHIIDDNLNSLYKNWNGKKSENLSKIRNDLKTVLTTKKIRYSIEVGKYDLGMKAIIPIFNGEKVVGILEMISHFNSISKQMKKFDVDSVVVAKQEYKSQLKQPFTNVFIDDYYVANLDAKPVLREHLKKYTVEKYFNNAYHIDNNYIIAGYELKNMDAQSIGYYIMFKKIDDALNVEEEFFMFKWLAFGLVLMMTIAFVGITILYITNRKQKKYYKNIIDSTTNIVLAGKNKTITEVNGTFFKYFKAYNSFEEFEKNENCVCSFFVKEDGYIYEDIDGSYWIEYLISNRFKKHKVKMKISDKEYYFSISASKLSIEEDNYIVVLSDITVEENYKKKLEYLSVTDSLTGIGNRRFFHQKLKYEIKHAKRYKHPLSIVMFDIDFFKQVNDTHGHSVGDEVLMEYTKLINSLLREGDVFCRIGGEEFMVILPYATRDDAQKIAQKLRVEVESFRKVVPITMSFGVVEYITGEDMKHIFKRVDDALYKAKDSGRNMVVVG